MSDSISIPVSVTPSGSAGGGNIFEVGSLFGDTEEGATSYGGDGASTGGGGGVNPVETTVPTSAVSGSVNATPATGFWATYGNYVLLGGAALALVLVIRKFRK